MSIRAAVRAGGVWLAAASVGLVGIVAARAQEPPKGWFLAGTKPNDYVASVDPKGGSAGGPCALLKAKTAAARTFGTLMQTVAADGYRGKRLRLSGMVRSADVSNWAGLWMRIDGPDPSRPLAFDNMQGRAIRGTTDWKRHEIVLDVAPPATSVNFGILLNGPGEVRLEAVKLDEVGPDVPVTGAPKLPRQPVNLDFKQR
jgi:hypothetical protein